jgi:hypothetical protein
MNAYKTLVRLIDAGFFDDGDPRHPNGLHRLLAASGELMRPEPSDDAIVADQRDALLLQWQRRQSTVDRSPLSVSSR